MPPESISQRNSAFNHDLSPKEIRMLFESILEDLTALRTALNAHTHGGVTAGGASTGVANAATAPVLNTRS